MGNPFGLLVKELEGTDAYAAMDIAVSRHGFDTPEALGGRGESRDQGAWRARRRTDAADNALTQALAEIETNPDISAEDRVKLKGLLMAVSLFANAPQSDVAAVEPYSQQIIRALRQPL